LYKKFCFFLCPRPPSSYYGLTVAFLVFLPFPAVCHKFPQRTLSFLPSVPPSGGSVVSRLRLQRYALFSFCQTFSHLFLKFF